MRVLLTGLLVSALLLSGCSNDPPETEAPAPAPESGADDAVVVAVLDFQFDPYHQDFLASKMPQALDDDASNDLPLGTDPALWLPGHPGAEAFASYGAMPITLPQDGGDSPQSLHDDDADSWADLEVSTADEIHMRYIPGTKVIGVVSFADPLFSPSSHGVGTTSVSVGNLHGSCPECLLVFVNNPSEEAFAWVTRQPWIDVITNSYGAGSFQVQGLVRDNIYDGCDLEAQRSGVERGQQIFFSGGNGFLNTFDAPPQTLWSCQKGPDWTVTVGAIDPDTGASYTGHGKPVDVASIGNRYPSAGAGSVSAEDTFSGTSNAAPVAAGIYAAALHDLRELLPGPSRIQDNGTVAVGPAGCGDAKATCALADGLVTVHEMREAFFRAAEPTSAYFQAMVPLTDVGGEVPAAGSAETELWTEGHGSFRGRLGDLDAEVGRAVAYATGEWTEEVAPELAEWMAAYSYCSQAVWGAWGHGYFVEGTTALPAPDPAWPYRTWLAGPCPDTVRAVVQAGSMSPFG